MRITDYITEKEDRDFCQNCNEICSRHCVVYRKAEMRYDEQEQEEKDDTRK